MSGDSVVHNTLKDMEEENEMRDSCAVNGNGEALDVLEERRWSLRNLSFRHDSEGDSGSKKIKERKSKSSSDVRHDDPIHNATNDSLSPSPDTPPSPPAQGPPTSRRKKIWNSFRKRTRRLRGKSREKDINRDFSPRPDASRGAEEERDRHVTSVPTVGVSRRLLYTRQTSIMSDGQANDAGDDQEGPLREVSIDTTSDANASDSRVGEDNIEADDSVAVVEQNSTIHFRRGNQKRK